MCCLAFFEFLRVTIPTDGSYDHSSHFSLKDVARKEPRLLQLALKQSKTDTFKEGYQVYVGATDNIICSHIVPSKVNQSAWSTLHHQRWQGVDCCHVPHSTEVSSD